MNKCVRVVRVQYGKKIYCNQVASISGGWCDECKEKHHYKKLHNGKEAWTPENNKRLFENLKRRRHEAQAKLEAEAREVQMLLTGEI